MHFGLKDLIVVSPRDNWLNNKSINAAKKATKIIKNIKVYDDLEIALSNFSYVVATTNRRRYLEKNSTNDFKFIKRKIIVNKKTAILFGPENSGLSNEDLRLSDIIFTIETSSKSNSLNLSHAVTVLSHKLFELNNLKITNSISIEKDNISKYQLSKFLNYVIEKLENKKFFTPSEKKESMKIDILGNRKIAICREMTKKFEEIITGNIEYVAKEIELKKLKGEIVIVLYSDKQKDEEINLEEIINSFKGEYRPSELAKIISDQTGFSKNIIYNKIIKLKEEN